MYFWTLVIIKRALINRTSVQCFMALNLTTVHILLQNEQHVSFGGWKTHWKTENKTVKAMKKTKKITYWDAAKSAAVTLDDIKFLCPVSVRFPVFTQAWWGPVFHQTACLWDIFLNCKTACWENLYIDYYILFVRVFTEHNPESGMSWYFSNNLHTCILTMNRSCL